MRYLWRVLLENAGSWKSAQVSFSLLNLHKNNCNCLCTQSGSFSYNLWPSSKICASVRRILQNSFAFESKSVLLELFWIVAYQDAVDAVWWKWHRVRGFAVCREFKTSNNTNQNWSAFYYDHALIILNNVSNKILSLPGQTAHTVYHLHPPTQFETLLDTLST